MANTLSAVEDYLKASGHAFEIMDCDPALADTRDFCAHYDIPFQNSANAILVKAKKGEPNFTLCVLLASHKLDVNHTVRKKLDVRKVSFASADETRTLTGMEIGGVTPVGLPQGLPVWVDADVMDCEYIILGGGNRESKLKVPPQILLTLPGAEVVDGLAIRIETESETDS